LSEFYTDAEGPRQTKKKAIREGDPAIAQGCPGREEKLLPVGESWQAWVVELGLVAVNTRRDWVLQLPVGEVWCTGGLDPGTCPKDSRRSLDMKCWRSGRFARLLQGLQLHAPVRHDALLRDALAHDVLVYDARGRRSVMLIAFLLPMSAHWHGPGRKHRPCRQKLAKRKEK
jgi:hypothetical protein